MATFRQDLPPAGGYKKIQWDRVFRPKVNGWKLLGGILAIKAAALTYWLHQRKKIRLGMYEDADVRLSVRPFFLAEQDRLDMKNYRAMRDEEAELMKNVPGWEVGTWHGKQIYNEDINKFSDNLWRERHIWQKEPGLNEQLRYAVGLKRMEP